MFRKREADTPRDYDEATKGGDCPNPTLQLRPCTYSDANDVWPWHELAKAHDVGELWLAQPAVLIYGDAACPDNAAAEAEQGDSEKCHE